jgi:zinc protease
VDEAASLVHFFSGNPQTRGCVMIPRPTVVVAALVGWLTFALTTEAPGASLKTDIKTFTLANGLQLVVVPDRRAPVVTHMVWYKVGAADEPLGQAGIAHFLEHLMFKGTPKHPIGEFSRLIRRNGGEENAFTSQDYTAYFQRLKRDKLELAMELEADRMANLVLREEDVLTELAVVEEERRSGTDNDPTSLLVEQMDAALYTAHPYGKPVIGWMTEVATLTRDDAVAFYRAHYTPRNAIVIVAGDVTAAKVKPLAEKYYGALPNSAEPSERRRPAEPDPIAARRVEMSDPRVGIDLVQRSYLTPSYSTAQGRDGPALDVLADILGGSTTSRLSRRLVIDERIAQEAGAFFTGDARDSGKFVTYAAAAPGSDLVRIESVIDQVLNEVAKSGVKAVELERAKKRLQAGAIYALDSQSQLARLFGEALTTGSTTDDVLNWGDRIGAVTIEDVRGVALKFLKPERSVTGVIRPPRPSNP